MDDDLTEYMEFAKQLAKDAGKIMLHHFHADIQSRMKSDKTVVTIADEEINQMVIDRVGEKYPSHSVSGEEASVDKKSNLSWVCDPIDGTHPYAKGIPFAAFSIALVEDGVPKIGVVLDPFTDRLYTAIKGKGAYLNDKPIRVSDKGLAAGSTVNIEWWSTAPYNVDSAMHDLSVETHTYVLHMPCVVNAACLVASGQFEACVYPGTRGKNVDIAAVKVIVEEAGGKVTDIRGKEQRYDTDINGAIISNGVVHDELVSRLRDVTNKDS